MGKTAIEWATHSLQVSVGCTKTSAGCRSCFAERIAYRLACMAQADIKAGRILDGRTWDEYPEVAR